MFIDVAAMDPCWHKTIPCWGRLGFSGELNIRHGSCLLSCLSSSLPLRLCDSQVDPHDIIIVSGGKKRRSFWLLSNWKYICSIKLESAWSRSNEAESCCNIFLHPLVCFCAAKSIFRKIEVELGFCECARVFALLRMLAHVYCEINSCGPWSSTVQRDKKRKSSTWKREKSEKEASVVLWLFCLKASDPNPSRQKMGNTSVILTLICKSSLSLIHF